MQRTYLCGAPHTICVYDAQYCSVHDVHAPVDAACDACLCVYACMSDAHVLHYMHGAQLLGASTFFLIQDLRLINMNDHRSERTKNKSCRTALK
jgi:hypothetical protein